MTDKVIHISFYNKWTKDLKGSPVLKLSVLSSTTLKNIGELLLNIIWEMFLTKV